MYILSPSLLSADFARTGEDIALAARGGAKYLHLDVMDGMFVPSISFGMPVIAALRKATDLIFDVHMMVQDPGRYIQDMKEAGADLITVHQEACTHLDRVLNQIRECGCRAGVALNPATPVEMLDCVLDQVDMVLIMTVNPGFGGQKLIPYTLDKVRRLRQIGISRGLNFDIEVDGGINQATAPMALQAGANILVAGSAVFQGDIQANAEKLTALFQEYEA